MSVIFLFLNTLYTNVLTIRHFWHSVQFTCSQFTVQPHWSRQPSMEGMLHPLYNVWSISFILDSFIYMYVCICTEVSSLENDCAVLFRRVSYIFCMFESPLFIIFLTLRCKTCLSYQSVRKRTMEPTPIACTFYYCL